MANIAELGFKADTSDLRNAKRDMDNLGPASSRAEKASGRLSKAIEAATAAAAALTAASKSLGSATDKLNAQLSGAGSMASKVVGANDNAARSYKRLASAADDAQRKMNAQRIVNRQTITPDRGADVAAYGAELDRLRAKFNPVFAVIRQYKSNVEEIRQANRVGAISMDEMNAALSRQRQAALTSIAALKNLQTSTTAAASASAAFGNADAHVQAYRAKVEQLRLTYDPLYAAQVRLKSALDGIALAQRLGAITAAQAQQLRAKETTAINGQIFALNNLAAAQKRAAQQMVNRQTITPDRGADVAAYGAELDRLRAKYNPAFALIKSYRAEMMELRRANQVGAISTSEFNAALSRLRQTTLSGLAGLRATRQGIQDIGASAGAMRANVGNLAAQFQDIGVTAAMGMSPMLIALQQGTQLSAALQQSGGSALRALGGAFLSVISPVSLVTIAIVALGVVAIQMVKWMEVAKSTLRAVADVLPTVAQYAALAAAGLALMYTPALIRAMIDLPILIIRATQAMVRFAAAIYATVGLPVLLVAGLVAIVAAANYFRDDLTAILGVDIVGVAKNAVNFIIGTFVGGFNGVKATWSRLPGDIGDVAYSTAARVVAAVNDMINGSIDAINGMIGSLPDWLGGNSGGISFRSNLKVDNPYEDHKAQSDAMAGAEMQKALGVDYLGKAMTGIGNAAEWASGKLRGWANTLGKEDDKKKKKGRGGKTEGERFEDIVSGAERNIASKRAEIAGVNMSVEAATRLKYQTQLLNEAQQKNINLTPQQRSKLMQLAETMTQLDIKLKNMQGFKELSENAQNTMRTLMQEREAIGLSGEAAARYKYETQLLNEAKQKGLTLTEDAIKQIKRMAGSLGAVDASNQALKYYTDTQRNAKQQLEDMRAEAAQLGMTEEAAARYRYERQMINQALRDGIALSPAQVEGLRWTAAEMARTEVATRRTREAMDFAKDATKGFLTDIRSGLSQNQSIWQTWGNAVMNVLNKVIDKMLDVAMDGILFKNGSGGQGGGFLGNLLPTIGLGGKSNARAVSTGGAALNAAGGLAGTTSGVSLRFAKGGAFSNGIVDRPTRFNTAEMGERGPEGILPLARGADGALGVQMYGGDRGGQSKANINVEISNTYDLSGALTGQDIASLVESAGERNKQQLARDLPRLLDQHARDGGYVGG